MGLFIRKSIETLQAEAQQSGSKTLKRVLGPVSLVALGVGVIIGAGLFSITGTNLSISINNNKNALIVLVKVHIICPKHQDVFLYISTRYI